MATDERTVSGAKRITNGVRRGSGQTSTLWSRLCTTTRYWSSIVIIISIITGRGVSIRVTVYAWVYYSGHHSFGLHGYNARRNTCFLRLR